MHKQHFSLKAKSFHNNHIRTTPLNQYHTENCQQFLKIMFM